MIRNRYFVEKRIIMGATQIREELHQYIDHADDRLINLMYAMIHADMGESNDELREEDELLTQSLDRGIQQSKEGKVTPHKEAMAKIRSKYKV
jgi:predicted transcriptional regulator